MVYNSDFYTTRRTYSRPTVTSYTVSKNEIPWEKVPYVPRPRLVADPVTAFGKRKTKADEKPKSIYERLNRDAIQPSAEVLARPIEPYVSAREKTRQRVFDLVRKHTDTVEAGGSLAASTFKDSMDVTVPRAHRNKSSELIRTQTPRYYLATDAPGSHRSRNSKEYSYTSKYESARTNSNDPYSRPERSSYSSTVERSSNYGPGGDYNYSSERSSQIGSGPGGYSYSSTTSGRLPGGTTYRHWSYRV